MPRTVMLFPGQGADLVRILPVLERLSRDGPGKDNYQLVCEVLNSDPINCVERRGIAYLHQNRVASLLIAFVGVEMYRRCLAVGVPAPDFVMGYSVGQWAGLHAAGCVTFEILVSLLESRAELMNECFDERPGKMASIIGIPEDVVEGVIRQVDPSCEKLSISNYNCVGQYTVSGLSSLVSEFLLRVEPHNPRKVVELPMEGAWHSPLLDRAAGRFADVLLSVPLQKPRIPVIDNVTGRPLPADSVAFKAQLARHLNSPVRWLDGMRYLIEKGCTEFVEAGHGHMLTQFGLFIDRTVDHKTASELLGA